MSPGLPRGTCPVCSADVALRKGGLIREHNAWPDGPPRGYSSTFGLSLAPKCPGSGQLAVEHAQPRLGETS